MPFCLQSIVDAFYSRVLGDEQLARFFDGINMATHRRKFLLFATYVMGGAPTGLAPSSPAARLHARGSAGRCLPARCRSQLNAAAQGAGKCGHAVASSALCNEAGALRPANPLSETTRQTLGPPGAAGPDDYEHAPDPWPQLYAVHERLIKHAGERAAAGCRWLCAATYRGCSIKAVAGMLSGAAPAPRHAARLWVGGAGKEAGSSPAAGTGGGRHTVLPPPRCHQTACRCPQASRKSTWTSSRATSGIPWSRWAWGRCAAGPPEPREQALLLVWA